MPRYRQESEDEGEDGWSRWIQPKTPENEGSTYRMACCDCGLVHEMEFRVDEGRAQFRARRHNRATAAMRAHQRRREGAS